MYREFAESATYRPAVGVECEGKRRFYLRFLPTKAYWRQRMQRSRLASSLVTNEINFHKTPVDSGLVIGFKFDFPLT